MVLLLDFKHQFLRLLLTTIFLCFDPIQLCLQFLLLHLYCHYLIAHLLLDCLYPLPLLLHLDILFADLLE